MIPFLEELRSSLKDGSFTALPVKQAVIPKKNGKVRCLGIPTLRDRVAQMALQLVLEPIFEADFYPSSYGYRPGRRSQDAIAEIHRFTRKPSTYDWVIEGDIKACFDNVDHHVLMDLAAERIKNRKVLRLVSAFAGRSCRVANTSPDSSDHVESRMLGQRARPVRRAGAGKPAPETVHGVPSPTQHTELDRHGAEFLFRVLTEREEKNSVAIASTDPRLCIAIVDRLTFSGTIIETGTDSYRLAGTRDRAEHAEAG
ncbi:reverse transcriptase domain-containing protein [Streptomyces sp. NPDC058755]|uniref:reverse transcriptase domain-containing protein n=1 Tax=Streptomyces sp. NPDC058755 TaxID=3346624 RepID=UPI0036985117